MKKLMLITTMAGIFIAQVNSHAQSLYGGVGVGYGFPSQVQSFNMLTMGGFQYGTTYGAPGTYAQTSTNTGSNWTLTQTSQSYSLGTGMDIGIYGGYMVNKNVGFELGISDKLSSKSTGTFTYTDNNTGSFPSTTTETDAYTLTSGSSIQFTPAVRLTAGDDKIHPFMVTGLIIGLSPTTTLEDQTSYAATFNGVGQPTQMADQVNTISGGMMIGFHGSLGILYMVSDKIGVSGEVYGNFLNWAPKKSLVTTLTLNGADSLSGKTTSFKETDYGSSATSSSTSSPGSPTQSTQVYMPFSSWGIKVSVYINLGGGGGSASPK